MDKSYVPPFDFSKHLHIFGRFLNCNFVWIMDLWLIWMLAALLLFLVEIFTPGFAAACLSIGCLFSCVLAAVAPDTLNWQIGLFVVGSLLSFIFVRPFALKVLSRRAERKGGYKSNMESLIGREATVIEMIPAEDVGRVKIDGDEWQAVLAREDDNEPRRDIQVGEKVIIVSYDSIILTVKTKKSGTPTA